MKGMTRKVIKEFYLNGGVRTTREIAEATDINIESVASAISLVVLTPPLR